MAGRAFVVKRLKPLPIEAIVRGYVAGSGWKDYKETGAICGVQLPAGLREAARMPGGAIFTPSTKAAQGAHDQNIPFSEVGTSAGQGIGCCRYARRQSLYIPKRRISRSQRASLSRTQNSNSARTATAGFIS